MSFARANRRSWRQTRRRNSSSIYNYARCDSRSVLETHGVIFNFRHASANFNARSQHNSLLQ
jgi:hypothetical protein